MHNEPGYNPEGWTAFYSHFTNQILLKIPGINEPDPSKIILTTIMILILVTLF